MSRAQRLPFVFGAKVSYADYWIVEVKVLAVSGRTNICCWRRNLAGGKKQLIVDVLLSSATYLTDTIRQIHFVTLRRRGQVAKAADCKSAIVGSTPTDASINSGVQQFAGPVFRARHL